MVKIDFHLHTLPTIQDAEFEFSLDKLQEYVKKSDIDGIAITNHNLFDIDQYNLISDNLDIPVFPGIEINLEKGHLLLISNLNEIPDFAIKCDQISQKIKDKTDFISVEDLTNTFVQLSNYLLIPHYDKKPVIQEQTLLKLKDYISAGEVNSPKKFSYCIKDSQSLVPVYFSDLRISNTLRIFPTRQTYLDIQNITFPGIKTCLNDKNKVYLSKNEGHHYFQVLNSGLNMSNGLNVILGERSSGKTFTLDRIAENFSNTKYLKQFSLLEIEDDQQKKRFDNLISSKHGLFTQEYLSEFKTLVDEIVNIDLEKNEKKVESYVQSLLKNASENELEDAFSKAKLFNETLFTESESDNLKKIINAAILIEENSEYRSIIEKYISSTNLVKLILELIEKLKQETLINLKKRWINELIKDIKKALQVRSAITPIEDIDLNITLLDKAKIKKFENIATNLKRKSQISKESLQGFTITSEKGPFPGALQLKNLSRKQLKFSDAYAVYDSPYKYLAELKDISGLDPSDYYKFFAQIEYKVLNKHGLEVSGGERSEFNLLQEIQEAQLHEMLLIDEPESSFDNIFLKNDVNQLIRDISKIIPVVIVTHNSTVGASIKPDHIIYTKREIIDKKPQFKIYSGAPSDKKLRTTDGEEIDNFEIMLNCLEAGAEAYNERRKSYEILKD